jgi:hypothetical protein
MSSTPILAAHQTKSFETLTYPLPPLPITLSLSQTSSPVPDASASTGTTLWLGAQILTHYLTTIYHRSTTHHGKRAIDLGAGTGLTTLCLAALGFTVTSTDLPIITSGILRENVALNSALLTGNISIRELDWTKPLPTDIAEAGWDVIVSADTIYRSDLLEAFWNTVDGLMGSKQSEGRKRSSVVVYVAVEIRDADVVSAAKRTAEEMGIRVIKTPSGKVKRKIEKVLGPGTWNEEWGGVEIWRANYGRV